MNQANLESSRRWDGVSRTKTATLQFSCLIIFTAIVVTNRFAGAYLAMSLALVSLFLGLDRVRLPAPFWWGVALLGWGLVSSFFAIDHSVALTTLEDRLKDILIFLVVMNAIRSERQLWIYLLVMIVAMMIWPVRGTLINNAHHNFFAGRVAWNGIYSNPNDLASISIVMAGCALSLAMARVQSRRVRRGTGVCAALLIFMVFLTQSRGAFIGLVVGMGPHLLKRTMKRPMVAICALVTVCIGVAVLPSSLWARLAGLRDVTSTSTMAEAHDSGSAENRWQIVTTGWRIFVDHPVLGIGLGCYPLANDRYRPDLGKRDTHNTYLNLAAEIGLPGLLLWAALVVSVLLHFSRCERRFAEIPSVNIVWLRRGVLGFLVAAIFGSYSGFTVTYLALGGLWAAGTLMSEQARDRAGRAVADKAVADRGAVAKVM